MQQWHERVVGNFGFSHVLQHEIEQPLTSSEKLSEIVVASLFENRIHMGEGDNRAERIGSS
jgi:hypothetical protein